jgi:hypothetical protein
MAHRDQSAGWVDHAAAADVERAILEHREVVMNAPLSEVFEAQAVWSAGVATTSLRPLLSLAAASLP